MNSRKCLMGMASEELASLASGMGEGAYRGRQIAHRLYRQNALNLEDMPELPKLFREKLAEAADLCPIEIAEHFKSTDKVQKLLVHNGDRNLYECVLLPYEDRVSCCLSTQVGCPMGCTFCATGLGGFDRNLSHHEIVAQYLLLQSITGRRISHIVFMGMGEPLLNLDNVLKAINIFTKEIGLSARHLTISTVGLVPQIKKLEEQRLPIHLALSLHSPLDEVRDSMMPVNHKWPVREVVRTMREYQKATGRKVTFEYLLIERVNDTQEQAKELAMLIKGIPCVVNLIPWNWVDVGQQGFKRPSRERVRAFRNALEKLGVNVTERVERGHDIAAACGQLAGRHQGKFAKRSTTAGAPESIRMSTTS
ncbi:MAG: 23S rRNA (adenine(2503)-C(2))-methyltransferase RlmN [Fimbriimonadaceae bacterium]|nr:23S rRNA (adenine(2503)-C(2))-methyltransferase RlmN [Fimbriimonadaceae bacterium]